MSIKNRIEYEDNEIEEWDDSDVDHCPMNGELWKPEFVPTLSLWECFWYRSRSAN